MQNWKFHHWMSCDVLDSLNSNVPPQSTFHDLDNCDEFMAGCHVDMVFHEVLVGADIADPEKDQSSFFCNHELDWSTVLCAANDAHEVSSEEEE